MSFEPRDLAEAALWKTTLEVATIFTDIPWLLVGAQMVMMLEREAGRVSGRSTGDIDAVVDLRVMSTGIRTAAKRLLRAGFSPAGDVHPYRFLRGREQVDLFAPDHLGAHADLTTVPPMQTTEIPGGTRALRTARLVPVRIRGAGEGRLPIPSIAGAIVLKTRAYETRRALRDVEDLARLLGLVADAAVVRAELKPAERAALAAVTPLRDPHSRLYRASFAPDDAYSAFRRLAD